ncbi:hypothetical protein ACFPER_18255 [Agromyces aurantiacus]|uniref:DUF559 domain-containing protein n=1 Tax=Agromyces aurantiacus TaxID=165814 RepID=A0ABV9RF22_9MICO|nr:hypothetical protein [Agromyces aurantiacus]MBM7505433.1 hypothetical protein [Agromyces aurantiacus]
MERARLAGVHPSRLDAEDLRRPFHGVRQGVGVPETVASRALAYAERMPPRQVFSHVTAALLWGMPLPHRLERDLRLHVAVAPGSTRPLASGVVGHVVRADRLGVVALGGLRLASPADTWCQLASLLEVDDLVAVGDFLVTGQEPSGRSAALCTRSELEAAIRRHRGCRGAIRLRAALALVRYGSLSRRETFMRLDLLRAGLPEPTPNLVVSDANGVAVAMVDLGFAEYRVGIEYQSDLHRDPARYRSDVRRLERLLDAGWLIVQATADDVSADGRLRNSAEFADRVAKRLRARGWRPGARRGAPPAGP